MRVLFLSRWFPSPADNGSKLRIHSLLKGLASDHRIHLVSFHEPGAAEPEAALLDDICEQVWTTPWTPYTPGGLRARMGFFRSTPRYLVDTYSAIMAAAIKQVVEGFQPNLVIASQIDMSVYRQSFATVPAILDEVEVGSQFDQWTATGNALKKARYGLTWVKLVRYLAWQKECFQRCTVVSKREQALLERGGIPAKWVEVIPNFVNVEAYRQVQAVQERGRETIVFTGSFDFDPNYEAMTWFLGSVFPRILARLPQVRLIITGRHGNRPLPSTTNVRLTGYVADVKTVVASSTVSVAPIRTGGGTRVKILEALALGTPVVATAKAIEGLDVEDGKHLRVADDPAGFSEHVINLIQNPDLRKSLSLAGRKLMLEEYDQKVVMPRFLQLVDRIARPDPEKKDDKSTRPVAILGTDIRASRGE